MNILTVPNGTMQANCYIVEGESRSVIIDPGYAEPKLLSYASENKDRITHILLTHRHFDRLNAAALLRRLTGAKIAVSKADECGLYGDEYSLADIAGGYYGTADRNARADIYLNDGDKLTVGELEFSVLHTPGHTEGGVCFLCENALFSGDTLFQGSVGRTDFPTGDPFALKRSLERLATLPDDTVVYPGHGSQTEIGIEKQSNIFMRR